MRASGDASRPRTQSAWPAKVLTQKPVASSHSLTVLSRDAEASLSGPTKHTALTQWSWPCR
ncbi:hypothetical protein IWW55_000668, partial [Coemansia sp. RSA 2706]